MIARRAWSYSPLVHVHKLEELCQLDFITQRTRLRKPRYWLRAPTSESVPDNTRSLDRLVFVYTHRILVKAAPLENWHEETLMGRMRESMPSFADVVFHRNALDMVEGRPYHIGVSFPLKACKADNEV